MYGPCFLLLLSVAAFGGDRLRMARAIGDYRLPWNQQQQGPLGLGRLSFGLK